MNRKIADLGIGLMGYPMARRLCEAGHTVHVWNRTQKKAARLAPFGATVHAQAADAVTSANIVIWLLKNGAVMADELFSRGVAQALKPDALVIEMSSIQPSETRDHAARLFEKLYSDRIEYGLADLDHAGLFVELASRNRVFSNSGMSLSEGDLTG